MSAKPLPEEQVPYPDLIERNDYSSEPGRNSFAIRLRVKVATHVQSG
jgi:hypothetical protein